VKGKFVTTLLIVLAVAFPCAASAGDVKGRVVLRPRMATEPSGAAGEDNIHSVVFLRGEGMTTSRRGGPLLQEVRWSEGALAPSVVVARLRDTLRVLADGEPGEFYIFSGATTKAVGINGEQPSRAITLDRFGPIEIYSPAQHTERAWVLVLENPFHLFVDTKGEFLLDGVPPGTYQVCAWRPGRPVACVSVEIPFEGQVEAEKIELP
jgi:hypothetical protein